MTSPQNTSTRNRKVIPINDFTGGLLVLDEFADEVLAQLRAMPGVCQGCVKETGRVWPKEAAFVKGKCQSCNSKGIRKLVHYDLVLEANPQ